MCLVFTRIICSNQYKFRCRYWKKINRLKIPSPIRLSDVIESIFPCLFTKPRNILVCCIARITCIYLFATVNVNKVDGPGGSSTQSTDDRRSPSIKPMYKMVKALFRQKRQRHYPFRQKPVQSLNHKVTEYFSVRKSDRRTKGEVLEERRRLLEYALKKGIEDGLEVRYIEDKGRGVFATKYFHKGEFVVEYSGELIDVNEAYKREEMYEQDENAGCYMYYFKYNEQQYCIDATAESGRLGRLVNHSRNGNLVTKAMLVDGVPRLALIAKTDIKKGQELLYDYGDRSKESLEHHPWLAS